MKTNQTPASAKAPITWNTGRTYSEHGQRMAAIAIHPNGVLMVDYDRHIECFLPECPLERNEIMRRYDANERTEYRPESMEMAAFVALRDWLCNVAKTQ